MTYVNVWKRPRVTHGCAGDGRTLCGVDISPSEYEEGGCFDADEAKTYVTCLKCLHSIETSAERARDNK